MMLRIKVLGLAAAVAAAGWPVCASAQQSGLEADAIAFGTLGTAFQMDLSPDGTKVVFVGPGPGPYRVGYVADLANGSSRPVVTTTDRSDRLRWCNWVSNSRLVCRYTGNIPDFGLLVPISRLVSLNPDGTDIKQIGDRRAYQTDGRILDWLPDDDENVLMMRLGSVEKVNTRTARSARVEAPRTASVFYGTDGHGNVRVMGIAQTEADGQLTTGKSKYSFRSPDDDNWKPLIEEYQKDEDFRPLTVDARTNSLYALRKHDGRLALHRIELDENRTEYRIASNPRVDIDDVVLIGEGRRVVGYSYAEEKRHVEYLDPDLDKLSQSLSKTLPQLPLVDFVAASADESKLLLFAGSDRDPGRYFLFDKGKKTLAEVFAQRPQLAGRTLAEVKPITYKAADGVDIPAYLTMPPGKAARGLPAVVMPHGGPSARDEWGFDWIAQFLAARGYAVIQPNYRGSAGYGEAWLNDNGFKGWRTSIGDVSAAARYLVSAGIADANRLAIAGWSYGGYAALQSAATDPSLYKAIVAIAPVTDLALLKAEAHGYASRREVADFVGTGPHLVEGSPVNLADRIAAPVLLAHGDLDINVGVKHAERMDAALKKAGRSSKFLRFSGLEHDLADSQVRVNLLAEIGALLERTIGH
jgi:dipeptidyl aminopeptidase/acylaminoacyl peptidase